MVSSGDRGLPPGGETSIPGVMRIEAPGDQRATLPAWRGCQWIGAVILALGAWGPGALDGRAVQAPSEARGGTRWSAEGRALSDEIAELERAYQEKKDGPSDEAETLRLLERARARQRRLLAGNPAAGWEQEQRLERLEVAAANERARAASRRLMELEAEAEAAERRKDWTIAAERGREALALQRAVNQSRADARWKNLVRERELVGKVQRAEAEPRVREAAAALEAARALATRERWAEARAEFGRARELRERINRAFAGTPFVDFGAVADIEAESGRLEATEGAAEVDARIREAEARMAQGCGAEAAAAYAEAIALQRVVNAKFPGSPWASAERVATLEERRQTALAAEREAAVKTLAAAMDEALRSRQVLTAEHRMVEAARSVEEIERAWPRAQIVADELRLKLAFLGQRRTALRALQDEVWEQLTPLEGRRQVLMLKTAVPQGLFSRVMAVNPSRSVGAGRPVDSVNWKEAAEFCRRLSWVLGWPVRLPRAEELENAAGDPWGDGSTMKSKDVAAREREREAAMAEWLDGEQGDADHAPVAGASGDPAGASAAPLAWRGKTERSARVGFRVVVEAAWE